MLQLYTDVTVLLVVLLLPALVPIPHMLADVTSVDQTNWKTNDAEDSSHVCTFCGEPYAIVTTIWGCVNYRLITIAKLSKQNKTIEVLLSQLSVNNSGTRITS